MAAMAGLAKAKFKKMPDDDFRSWYDDVIPNSSRILIYLVAFSMVFVGGFLAWAVFAPIGGATIIDGRIRVEGYNRTINYQDGGIVKSIEVKEGERVRKGDVLIRIDDSEIKSSLAIQNIRKITIDIRLARYQAEQINLPDFSLDEQLIENISKNENLLATLQSQRLELQARIEEANSVAQIYQNRFESQTLSLQDLEEIVEERKKRLDNIKHEVNVSDDLLEKGLTTRDRNFTLKRQLSVDQEQLETLMVQIAERRSQLARSREDQLRWQAQRNTEISNQLVSLNADRAEVIEKIELLQNMLSRTVITSPIDGYVVQMHVNTIGSSVAPGSELLELLPTDLPLIVEGWIDSRNIEAASVGSRLEVRVATQDRQRSMMFLDGTITYVSPDTVLIGQPEIPMYVVRGKLHSSSLENFGFLRPGANVQIFLIGETKNFIHYVLDPILNFEKQAFTH